ncbi:transposase, partial [Methanosarcina mazei]|uniref:transposase n=1 Tax=Methanosarcina mazei TaxID=2209 RepID=UPI00064E7464
EMCIRDSYKENLGFREFLTRGLKSVRNEFNLVCTAINLRKIWIYFNQIAGGPKHTPSFRVGWPPAI